MILMFISPWVTPNVGTISFLLHAQLCIQFVFVSATGPFYNMTPEERMDADNRSVYVGNVRLCLFLTLSMFYLLVSPHSWSATLNKSQVDYGATADELEIHFNGCGPVNRVTILCDRFSGHPKGWVQFVHSLLFLFFSSLPPFDHKIRLLSMSASKCLKNTIIRLLQLCLHWVLRSRLCAECYWSAWDLVQRKSP